MKFWCWSNSLSIAFTDMSFPSLDVVMEKLNEVNTRPDKAFESLLEFCDFIVWRIEAKWVIREAKISLQCLNHFPLKFIIQCCSVLISSLSHFSFPLSAALGPIRVFLKLEKHFAHSHSLIYLPRISSDIFDFVSHFAVLCLEGISFVLKIQSRCLIVAIISWFVRQADHIKKLFARFSRHLRSWNTKKTLRARESDDGKYFLAIKELVRVQMLRWQRSEKC